MPLFTPGKLKVMDAGFRRVAEALIAKFPTTGEVEFIGDYANPLATLIITELLGIPYEDRSIFLEAFAGGTPAEVGASAPLARAETRLILEILLDRFPRIRFDETRHGPEDEREFHYENSYVLRGLSELHLVFQSASQAREVA